MNTLYFKYAVEVERTRSISKAAKNLVMAQPNLSKAIKELEESLGFAIFERTPRGVIPTGKGNIFLDYARNILSQIDSIHALSASADKNVQKFSITVSRGSYVSNSIVSFVAGLDANMGLELDIRETSSMEVVNNVISGRYNLGVIRYRSGYEQYYSDYLAQHRIASEKIWEYEFLVITSRRSPLASMPVIVPDDLAGLTEILHGDTVIPYLSSSQNDTRNTPVPAKNLIRLYERCNQFELLSTLPTAFMWASPLPDEMLNRYNLVQRRCSFPNNAFKDLLIYPESYSLSTLELRFMDELYATRDALMGKKFR